jgi:Protein of unknown function (DUF2905)
MARFLIILGAALVVLGFAWPLLAKLGLGRLPGDILIERENFALFIPLTSGLIVSIVVSLVVSVLLWIARK